jgi:glutamate carboxypeptidase
MAGHAQILAAYLQKNKAEQIGFLQSLVSLETHSLDPDSQAAVFDLLAEKFNSIGYRTLRMPGHLTGGYMIASPEYRQKHLPIQLMVGHCDTVWPEGTITEMPFEETGPAIAGPGVYDMKAGISQMVFALEALRDLELRPAVTPVVLINSDEEIGSRESTVAVRRLSRIAARAYVLEPPVGPEGKLKTARKGIGRFTLTIEGKAAHAGLDPEKGQSAIVELSHQIQKLFAMNDHARGISVNVGMIEGGVSVNTVAPISKAVIDVRVLSREDGEMITGKILGLKPENREVRLTIEGSIGRPPMERTPRNRRLWELARQTAARMNIELGETTAGGGSDGNTTSLYTATLDGLGTTGDGAHAAHEHIIADKLTERTILLALLLLAPPIEPAKNERADA